MPSDPKVVRAKRRLKEIQSPLRRALAALGEVENLEGADVFGRVHLDPHSEGDQQDLRDMVTLAAEDYPGHELEVIIVIGGAAHQRESAENATQRAVQR